ncbi:acyl-CoA desaturase [Alkanindiges hydrocarboniclasticus]|uniref:Acyl-CoA desaturase n=1 Tax=Alkanindiges hydrocarboniclasticus TaxID=1907941 RepID=A0A1S8CVG2_9GAMM|nr:acyl-CoA desaturase [Alkanindiges hydrocarboniclasticus]ONG41308.1 acyl-CoA desaturase [Alkanindiges hydrocarboniclasticus]
MNSINYDAVKAAKSKSRALSFDEIQEFGRKIEAIRQDTMAKIGKEDSDYIYKVRNFVRYTEIASRGMLMFGGWIPPVWLLGTAMLGVSKIVENMELGHNVMHGQFDWLNDPSLNGANYDWDTICTGEDWKYTHNYIHHTYTNVLGKDHDIGYGVMRMTRGQKWEPRFLFNVPVAFVLSTGFEWLLSLQRMEFEKVLSGEKTLKDVYLQSGNWRKKALRQFAKDYVFFPVIAGPMFLPVIAGNFFANIIRNYWSSAVIYCGHFTEDAEMMEDNTANETKAEWYLRQIRGSSNFTGGKIIHFMSGNLSHQIEHHLFPDVPANRYQEMAPKVRAVCEEYGQNYNSASFAKQFASVWARLAEHSLPDQMVDKIKATRSKLSLKNLFARAA